MNAMTPIEPATGLVLLRAPFPPHQISKLPRGGTTLDYVGHAALTDRLLDADPHWDWEPLAYDAAGLPAFDATGGLWIKLTVCGKTRLGYGHAGAKKGGDAIKEVIGDALRNAGMRFGAALDLWHKGDLHADEEQESAPAEQRREQPRHDPVPLTDAHRDMMMTMLERTGSDVRAFCQHFGIASVKELPDARFDEAAELLERKAKKAAAQRTKSPNAQADDILADEVPY